MPISFEAFKKAIEALINNWEMQTEINQVYHKHKEETRVYNFGLDSALVSLLEEILHDKETGWIGYWLYELEAGKDYTPGDVVDKDGDIIPLATIEDLWNLLQDNLREGRV